MGLATSSARLMATAGSASGTDRSALARRSADSLWHCGLAVTMGFSTTITVSNASAGWICERSTHPPVPQQHQLSNAL
jgi:hypothetical protein